MKNKKTNHQIKGFSLIEVLIALLVLSVGLLALGVFQGSLLRSASDSVARAEAVALAEEKLEDLRSFTVVEVPVGTTWAASNSVMAFDYIGNDSGGRLASTSDYSLKSSATGSVNFNRRWAVTNITINGVPAKQVLMTVSWQDKDATQQVQLSTTIANVKPGGTVAATGSGSNAFDPPGIIANIEDGSDRHDVVDSGEGVNQRTGKPTPDVFHTGDYNKVQFDVVSYVNATHPTVVKRQSFTTVNCLCTFSAIGSGSGFTPGYTLFENATETIHDQVDGFISGKNVGVVANNLQPSDCDLCCRDHHDGGTGDNPDIDYVPGTTGTGDHRHIDGSGTTATAVGDDYLEACRIKIIGGNKRVYQDWQLKNLTVMTDDFLDTSGATYTTQVSDFVLNTARGTSTTKPAGNGTKTIAEGGNDQLASRVIYMDDVVETGGGLVTYTNFISASHTDKTDAPLLFIPFVELNLTKLANWRMGHETDTSIDLANEDPCPPSGTSTDFVCVTNEDIVDETLSENNYSRGLINGLNAGSVRAIAYANRDNTGITGSVAINPTFETTAVEALTETELANYLTVTVSSGASNFSISGTISFCADMTNPQENTAYGLLQTDGITFTGGDSGTCVVENKNGGASSSTYHCDSIIAGSTVTINYPSSANPDSLTAGPFSSGTPGVDIVICNI